MSEAHSIDQDFGVWAPEIPLDESKRWRSASHERGPGRVHYMSPDDAGNTLCGKRLREILGARAASDDVVTCKLCISSSIRRVEREKMRQQYEQRIRDRVAQEARRQAQWEVEREERRRFYSAHIKSPKWRAKADLVLRRAGFICEGCLTNRATQVHHLTYDHLGDEFAWELRAVCAGCHERFHEDRSANGTH